MLARKQKAFVEPHAHTIPPSSVLTWGCLLVTTAGALRRPVGGSMRGTRAPCSRCTTAETAPGTSRVAMGRMWHTLPLSLDMSVGVDRSGMPAYATELPTQPVRNRNVWRAYGSDRVTQVASALIHRGPPLPAHELGQCTMRAENGRVEDVACDARCGSAVAGAMSVGGTP